MLSYLGIQNSILLHMIVCVSSKMTSKLTELSASCYDLKGALPCVCCWCPTGSGETSLQRSPHPCSASFLTLSCFSAPILLQILPQQSTQTRIPIPGSASNQPHLRCVVSKKFLKKSHHWTTGVKPQKLMLSFWVFSPSVYNPVNFFKLRLNCHVTVY